ncbi:cyclophilin-like protein [Aaosphaeria arxii CBS 175.79]|uniref:Cyclophilin-like protein n=1 Tax=Aaosphaeria arxii CBS 175.79 TaxID=1450172 RepID=A0A6A5XII2_9PLEO|nr:cyclophilin-like protein [Aaosphaeria arxii CBS 175.79]KAF2012637.1 cyclophilin-like protein [Aaosphaeria arxii CBS 175.79]
MSTVYNLEPNPTAKVLLHTTAGDLELELFAKQTPKTSRNFIQLCLDGYYDNTIFHRLVKGFIIQGGDPTGTGHGGESSYDGEPFEDEFHSRLKYNRRGLLGMANTGKKDDNGSQFFFTLGNTPELTGKNTMFGRIAGDTIYNLLKMAEAEIADGSEERPMYATKITGTEIIINPFEDMVQRVRVAERTEPEVKKVKKPKRKAGKAVLSFGDDLDEPEAAPVKKKPKYNAALVMAEDGQGQSQEAGKQVEAERAIPIRKPVRRSPSRSPPPQRAPKSPIREKPRSPPPPPPPPREPSPEQSKLDRVNAQIAAVKASLKRNPIAHSSETTKKKSILDTMIPANTVRGRKRGANNGASEQASLDILAKFKSKLEAAAPPDTRMKSPPPVEAIDGEQDVADQKNKDNLVNGADEVACDLHFIVGCQSCKAWDKQDEEESDDDAGWMAHSLTFAKDRLGKDLEWKRKNEEELLVIDPRERAQELKGPKGGKREWDSGKDNRGKKGVGLGAR